MKSIFIYKLLPNCTFITMHCLSLKSTLVQSNYTKNMSIKALIIAIDSYILCILVDRVSQPKNECAMVFKSENMRYLQ